MHRETPFFLYLLKFCILTGLVTNNNKMMTMYISVLNKYILSTAIDLETNKLNRQTIFFFALMDCRFEGQVI